MLERYDAEDLPELTIHDFFKSQAFGCILRFVNLKGPECEIWAETFRAEILQKETVLETALEEGGAVEEARPDQPLQVEARVIWSNEARRDAVRRMELRQAPTRCVSTLSG